jgi:hypothetical protein
MRYFRTKYQRYSARLTALIMLLLILLLFYVGPGYMDPPLEYGVAVNFGTNDTGDGLIQPNGILDSQSNPIAAPTEESKIETSTKLSEPIPLEEVLTNDDLKSTDIAKAKAESDTKEKVEADRLKKEANSKAKKKAELDALMGGIGADQTIDKGSEGDNEPLGDKGQLDGTPYKSSYFGGKGSGNGGLGYGLSGRGKPKSSNKIIPDCDEEGTVVVKIYVNQNGTVTEAIPGQQGTIGDACLFDAAKKTALTYKWKADNKAPFKQIGFVIVNFKVRQ